MMGKFLIQLMLMVGVCSAGLVQGIDTAAARQSVEFEEFIDEYSSEGYTDSLQVTSAMGKFGLVLIIAGVAAVFLLETGSGHQHSHSHSH